MPCTGGVSEANDDWYRANEIDKMYFVYVLKSLKDENFYIGFTNDIEKRFQDHNSGKNPSTESRRPFKLVYYESHLSKEDALRREAYFKTTKGKATLKQILRTTLALKNNTEPRRV